MGRATAVGEYRLDGSDVVGHMGYAQDGSRVVCCEKINSCFTCWANCTQLGLLFDCVCGTTSHGYQMLVLLRLAELLIGIALRLYVTS